MGNFTLGAGLASLAFWGFIAAVVVAGIWYDIRKKAEQQKTIRALVESGQQLDPEVIDSLFKKEVEDPVKVSKDMKLGAVVVCATGVGLALFGVFLSFIDTSAFFAMLGVGAMLFMVAVGLWVAAGMKLKNN
jgi:Flp pilus assembly protein TadB